MEYDGKCIDASPFYGAADDSSDQEIANSKCVGQAALCKSECHARLLANTATRRKLEAREDFTVPF
jgi:hypothetical protein